MAEPERKCSTCKFYEPAPIWRKGWCRNPLLYAPQQSHLVAEDDLDCSRGLSDYWEGADGTGPNAGVNLAMSSSGRDPFGRNADRGERSEPGAAERCRGAAASMATAAAGTPRPQTTMTATPPTSPPRPLPPAIRATRGASVATRRSATRGTTRSRDMARPPPHAEGEPRYDMATAPPQDPEQNPWQNPPPADYGQPAGDQAGYGQGGYGQDGYGQGGMSRTAGLPAKGGYGQDQYGGYGQGGYDDRGGYGQQPPNAPPVAPGVTGSGPRRVVPQTAAVGKERSLSYYTEERYWTDYAKLVIPVVVVIALLGGRLVHRHRQTPRRRQRHRDAGQ